MLTPLNSSWRWFGVVMLLITAGTHVPLIPEHLAEAPYAGVLFIALTVVSLVFAVLLVRWDSPAVWTASGVLCLLAVLAFFVSRTVGLPQLADDIGNWTEPLGFPAVAAELLATLAAVVVLTHRSHPHGSDLDERGTTS